MSEVLRAIMDQNSVSSQVAFYACKLTETLVVTGTPTLARRRAYIQMRPDTYFLAMGAAQFFTLSSPVGGGGTFTGGKTQPTTFSIQRSANHELFSIAPQIKANQNYNLNNWASWAEYVLFEPAELLTVFEDTWITDATTAYTATTSVLLQGVEYKMQSRG